MNRDDVRIGAIVRYKSGQSFSAGGGLNQQYTTMIEFFKNGLVADVQVHFSTGTWLGLDLCPSLLELVEPAPKPAPKSGQEDSTSGQTDELTGGSVDYYTALVHKPTSGGDPYELEVNDFIEAFDLNFAEGNIVKAVVRLAQLRREAGKPGSTMRYEAGKTKFFGDRVLEQNT
jgi:hypothetical protein